MNRLKTKFIIHILAIFISSLIYSEEYNIGNVSSWVEKIEVPSYELNPEDIINGEYYLLSDMQVRLDPREFFNHYAILIDNSTGLENNSQISIDFDPDHEDLTIHKIQIIRDGLAIDKLDSAITSVIQKENELEKLIYNGTKSFYAILSDMRIGDILEVSFTVKEKDPIFSGYSDRFYVQWAVISLSYLMAFSEFETERYKQITEVFIEEIRPSENIRSELDIIYEIENQSIIIYEVRPAWDNPKEIMKIEVVKLTYVKTSDSWRLFWQRRDMKWHSYDPDPEVDTLEEGLRVVKNDDLGCFWG